MLDLVGTVFTTTAVAVILISVASTLPLRLGQRIGLALITGGWLGVATATAAAGAFADPARGAIAILALFALPLAATATLALLFPAVRQVLLALPAPLLVGLNVVRVGGVLFLLLAGAGRLAGPFPYLAGWGDIITGVTAIPDSGSSDAEEHLKEQTPPYGTKVQCPARGDHNRVDPLAPHGGARERGRSSPAV